MFSSTSQLVVDVPQDVSSILFSDCSGETFREEANTACRQRIETVANVLGLEGFARIDAFVHADTGEVNHVLDLSPNCLRPYFEELVRLLVLGQIATRSVRI